MSYTTAVRNYITGDCKMDFVGIASASALDSEPKGYRPGDILPGAKSIIVFGRKLSDGAVQAAFRAMEDGNMSAQSSYGTYGCDQAPNILLFFMKFNICEFIERTFGETAFPVPSGPMQNVTPVNVPLPVFAGPTRRVEILNLNKAAVAAGLGEIAWSNWFVTPENGPRQQLDVILTTMELEYDKPYSGPRLCDPSKCQICAQVCPTHAISGYGDRSRSICASGKTFEVAEVNPNACAVAALAFRSEFSGATKTPDQIMGDNPTDGELAAAYAAKPISHNSIDHYPKYFCNKCLLYCPLGSWEARFGAKGFSKFGREAAGK